jgi:hypothetical protein
MHVIIRRSNLQLLINEKLTSFSHNLSFLFFYNHYHSHFYLSYLFHICHNIEIIILDIYFFNFIRNYSEFFVSLIFQCNLKVYFRKKNLKIIHMRNTHDLFYKFIWRIKNIYPNEKNVGHIIARYIWVYFLFLTPLNNIM